MKRTDYHYIQCAKDISNLSDFKQKVGCIVVYNHTIISSGVNTHKTHPTQYKYNEYRFGEFNEEVIPKAHAEIIALNKIQYLNINWHKVKVYVYRNMKNGKPGLARPCNACMRFIKDLGIRNIYYSTYDGFAYERVKDY